LLPQLCGDLEMAQANFIISHAKALIVLTVIALVGAGAVYDLYLETPPVVETNAALMVDTKQWPEAPDFNFTDIDGHAHKLSNFRDKIVLIDFWATWCSTCLVEFPNIVKFVSGHKGDVVLIALSSDSGVQPIRDFIKKQSVETQTALKQPYVFIALDEKQKITRDIFLTEMYPETVFVAPGGHMVKKSVGETQWDQPEMTAFFDALNRQSGKPE
jgi:thiol-disulfide isomerase/thioredoxin